MPCCSQLQLPHARHKLSDVVSPPGYGSVGGSVTAAAFALEREVRATAVRGTATMGSVGAIVEALHSASAFCVVVGTPTANAAPQRRN